MAHITVQIRPCCTVPFGLMVPNELSEKWQPTVRARVLHDPRKDGSRVNSRLSVRRGHRSQAAHSGKQAK